MMADWTMNFTSQSHKSHVLQGSENVKDEAHRQAQEDRGKEDMWFKQEVEEPWGRICDDHGAGGQRGEGPGGTGNCTCDRAHAEKRPRDDDGDT